MTFPSTRTLSTAAEVVSVSRLLPSSTSDVREVAAGDGPVVVWSATTALTTRIAAGSLEKIPTTSVRPLISLFKRVR